MIVELQPQTGGKRTNAGVSRRGYGKDAVSHALAAGYWCMAVLRARPGTAAPHQTSPRS